MFDFKESACTVTRVEIRGSIALDKTDDAGAPSVAQVSTVRVTMDVPFDVWGAPVLTSDGMTRAVVQMATAQDAAESGGGKVESVFALKGDLGPGDNVLTFRRYGAAGPPTVIELGVEYTGAPTIRILDAETATIRATFEAMVTAADLLALASIVKNDATVSAQFKPAQQDLFDGAGRPMAPVGDDAPCCGAEDADDGGLGGHRHVALGGPTVYVLDA